MIDQFWVATGVAIGAAIALFGGYWKLTNAATDVHRKFLNDLRSMEAVIRSTKLIPKIVALYQSLVQDQAQNVSVDVSEILARQEYGEKIRSIAEAENESGTIKVSYSDLKSSLFDVAHSMLYLGILSLLTIPYFYIYGTGFPLIDQWLGLALGYTVVVLILRLVPQIYKHDRTRRKFVDKYDEVMVGVQ